MYNPTTVSTNITFVFTYTNPGNTPVENTTYNLFLNGTTLLSTFIATSPAPNSYTFSNVTLTTQGLNALTIKKSDSTVIDNNISITAFASVNSITPQNISNLQTNYFVSGTNKLNLTSNNLLPVNAYWKSVTSSTSGQYLVSCAYGGNITISSNFGNSWTALTANGLPLNNLWNCVTSSKDGSIIAACVYGGNIYLSSNFGNTWRDLSTNGLPLNRNWSSITSSTNASILAACINGGNIYLSTNSGTFWTDLSTNGLPLNNSWSSIASSSPGTFLAACDNYGNVYVSYNTSGTTWSPVTSLPNAYSWSSITMSNTGQYMGVCANVGPIYISTNFGVTWNPWNPVSQTITWTLNFSNINCSGSGQIFAACVNGGNIFINFNYGQGSWYILSYNGTNSQLWNSLTLSSSGQYLTGVSSQNIYSYSVNSDLGSIFSLNTLDASGSVSNTVTNYIIKNNTNPIFNNLPFATWTGVTSANLGKNIIICGYIDSVGYMYSNNNFGNGLWTPINAPGVKWSCITSANTCKNIVACANPGVIYSSNDFGVTWQDLSTNSGMPTGNKNWTSITSDITGTYLAACNGQNIYISSNSGSTWTSATTGTNGAPINANWRTIASSSNWEIIIAGVYGGDVYKSNDNGQTWVDLSNTSLPINANWTSVSSSSSGQYLGVTLVEGLVYISKNFGASWTTVSIINILDYYNITISSSGQNIFFNQIGGFAIYYSTDYGTTFNSFTPNNTSLNFTLLYSVNLYDNGYMICVGNGVFLIDYITNNTWIIIVPTSGISGVAPFSLYSGYCYNNQIIMNSINSNSNLNYLNGSDLSTKYYLLWKSVMATYDGNTFVACNKNIPGSLYEYVVLGYIYISKSATDLI